MFYTIPSFLVLFVFFLFMLEYYILKKEKNHKTLIRKMALQGNYRQKYRHYGEHFISPSVAGLPCFFGFLTSTTFARKKRTNFHHFIEFIECFYLNLQSISIAPVKELKHLLFTFYFFF